MNFSRIDIWWLLNKHIKFIIEVRTHSNKVMYLYNEAYDENPKNLLHCKLFKYCAIP